MAAPVQTLPLQGQDTTGNFIGNVALGITPTVASSVTTTAVNINSGGPGTTVFVIQLTSGGGTVKVSVNSGTPNFGSPTATVAIADTKQYALTVNTTSSNLWVAVEYVDSGSGSVILDCYALMVMQKQPGQDWTNVHSAINATASTNGYSGSGALTITAV